MNNKQSHKAKITRFSIFTIVLLLSNLCTITLASGRPILSRYVETGKPYEYFKKIPKREDFKNWKEQVVRIVTEYKLEEYLGEWLEDIVTIDQILTDLDKTNKGKNNIGFAALIEQHQIKTPSFLSSLFCYDSPSSLATSKLVIRKIAPNDYINTKAIIAVIDQLHKVSVEEWEMLYFSKSNKIHKLCIDISEKELKEDEKNRILQLLTFNVFKHIKSAITSYMFDPKHANTSDNKAKKTA